MEPPRPPGMRRKSSASNLLSSFQGSRVAQTTGITNGATPKEYDESLFGDGTAATTTASSLSVPSSSTESVRETINRRLLAIAHIRQSYEGKQHWLNTVLVDSIDLQRTYNNAAMKKRTWKFAVLGMSLASIFEARGSDVLKSLTTILNEFDQMPDQPPEEAVRPKMRSLLRRQTKRPGASGFDSSDMEPALAMGINIPFSLDYFQVLITFCDVLTEIYIKLRNIVSSAAPMLHSGMAHSVPPASGYAIVPQTPNHSNNPIYSQLFTTDHTAARAMPDSPTPQTASVPFIPGGLAGQNGSVGAGTAEIILKLDGRFKKIVNQLLKELDAMARESIKDELSSLDPLLRNMGLSIPAEGAAGLAFDFDV